jgi:hypothetical protein
MDGYLRLSAAERKTCLETLRAARTARRALVLLLLDDDWSYREIGTATYASPSLVRAVQRDFGAGGVERVLGGVTRTVTMATWL